MNPTFSFTLGKPLEDGSGRWTEGSVKPKGNGYQFTAHLMLRKGGILSCRSVCLDIERPFVPTDFAAFLKLINTGAFETSSRELKIDGADKVGAQDASAIVEAARWESTLPAVVSPPLSEDLTCLTIKLEEARKCELLQLAFARFSGSR